MQLATPCILYLSDALLNMTLAPIQRTHPAHMNLSLTPIQRQPPDIGAKLQS
jgi:hypothetical protein